MEVTMSKEQVKKWSKEKSPYLKLTDGESVTVRLKSCKAVVKTSFGEEKEILRWTLEGVEDGEKIFDVGSPTLNSALGDHIGQWIQLKRTGEGTNTRYSVKKADDPNKAWDEDKV